MDDSMMYSGVDNEPKGMFDNEIVNEEVQSKIEEQDRLIQELTPQLEKINEMIDMELKAADSVDHFGDATSHPEKDIRAELRASFLYKQYLINLKSKFRNILEEK